MSGWTNLNSSELNKYDHAGKARTVSQIWVFITILLLGLGIGSYIVHMTGKLAALPQIAAQAGSVDSFTTCQTKPATTSKATVITRSFYQVGAGPSSNSKAYYERKRQAGDTIIPIDQPCESSQVKLTSTLYVN